MTYAKRMLILLAIIAATAAITRWVEPTLLYGKYLADGIGISLLALAYLGNRYAQRRLNNILLVSCDPDAYIKKLRRIMNGIVEKRSPAQMNVRRLELCSGLFAAGRYDELEAELRKITVFPSRTAAIYRFNYLQLHFYNHLRKGENQYATDLFETLRAKPLAYHFKPAVVNSMKQGLANMSYGLRMAQGNYEGAEEHFLKAMHANTYSRVAAQLNLSRIYQHRSETDKVRAAYQYVIAYGSKLYAVKLAADALIALDSPPSSLV